MIYDGHNMITIIPVGYDRPDLPTMALHGSQLEVVKKGSWQEGLMTRMAAVPGGATGDRVPGRP